MKLWHVISPYYIVGVTIWYLSINPVFGQTSTAKIPSQQELDSIIEYYTLSNKDSLPLSRRSEYASSFLNCAIYYQKDSLIYKGLMQKTWLLGKEKKYDSAIVYAQKLYDFAAKNADTLYIKNALLKLGIYHKRNINLTEAFRYYNESFKIDQRVKDSLSAGKSLLQLANIQEMLGDYSGSKTTAIDGLKYVENTSNIMSLSGLYHVISVANRKQKKYDEAFKYNSLALELAKDSVSIEKIKIGNVLMFENTKALILADTAEYNEALLILSELEENTVVRSDKVEYARVIGNLGYVQWLQNKDNQISEKLYLKAREIRNSIQDIDGLFASNIYLTKYYFIENKTKALHYAEAAYQNALEIKSLTSIIEALGFIFQLKDDVREEAIVYDKTYHTLNTINQSNREIYAVTKYENEKLATTNVTLKKEKDTIAQWAMIILFLLLLSITGVGYYYYKQHRYKKRFLLLLASSREAEEKQTVDNVINKKKESLSTISPETLQHLITSLQQFEEKEQYLTSKINAQTLAKKFKSNTSYLSIVVNAYKQKSINQYINDLRVAYAIRRLQTDVVFRKYTIKAIAQEIGFNSSENFAKKFYKKTGIYPSYYIKKLEEEN
ncbi:helix-turn-helix domain-containing protein [Aquimarina gracilis]|uniref:Helix-turn-helix domain-containing protein n=1 Tax=Aquimarina gracilis TaxID=874422 RepID=A0ABU5ZVX5_9FLAO|nr:helix-turn-helix domain-containing protein [Aquimarina gracilis]MEB3346025.1 helix-turn-helix domain-containing protein [Aquimarina gracilis]